MSSFVAGTAGTAPAAVARIRQPAAHGTSPFISWLRRTRRSAWLAIGPCLLFRAGDALVHDRALPSESPAMAMGAAR